MLVAAGNGVALAVRSRIRSLLVPELSLPTVEVHESSKLAVAEYRAEGCFPEFDRLDVRHEDDFAAYVDQLVTDPRALYDRGLPPMTAMWWIDGSEYLGRVSIWHRLDGVFVDSGHIGYDIRRSARGRGHATAMLAAALPVVAGLGIDPALVTCRANNTASQRVIKANGGQLVEQCGDQLRFRLPTRW